MENFMKSILRFITAALLSCSIYQTTKPVLIVNAHTTDQSIIIENDQPARSGKNNNKVVFEGTLHSNDIAYVPLDIPTQYLDIKDRGGYHRIRTASGEPITDNHVIYICRMEFKSGMTGILNLLSYKKQL